MKNSLRLFLSLTTIAILTLSTHQAFAAAKKKGGKGAFAGGAMAIGFGLSFTTAEQEGLNSLVDAAKSATNSTAGKLSSATEYVGHLTFRFASGMLAVQVRPSLFSQSSTGSGSDGSHEYKLDGYTIFPLFRYIPLSNDFIDFYIQGGLGYGSLNGKVSNGATNASFSGSAFGTQFGLGAEFCFLPDHCFNIEGNYRYMPISRNIVSSASGLPSGVSQASPDKELEDLNGTDIPTTLSGISGIIGYTYNF